MKITLNRIIIENFKGIKHRDITFTSSPFTIIGENETGKTSIFDAYLWALTDKDSLGQSDAKILPVNEQGDVIDEQVETDVTVYISIDDQVKMTFRRTLCPKLTKKRKSVIKEITGSTYKYYVNNLEVPVKKTVYTQKINELFGEKIFKLLSSPYHFASLPWTEQRSILFEIGGEQIPSEQDILRLPEFIKIQDDLKGVSFLDGKKNFKASARKINKKIELIPSAIKENKLQLTEVVAPPDVKKKKVLQEQIKNLIVSTETDNTQIVRNKIQAEVKNLQLKVENEENLFNQTIKNIENDFQRKTDQHKNKISTIENKNDFHKTRIQALQEQIKSLDVQLETMRENYVKITNEIFPDDGNCPTCGQPLPADMLEEHQEKFNLQKTKRLRKVAERGKEIKTQSEEAQKQIKHEREMQAEALRLLLSYKEELKKDMQAFEEWKAQVKQEPEALCKAKKQYTKAANKLKNLKGSKTDDKQTEDKKRLEQLQEQLTEWEQTELEYKRMLQIKKRIQELQDEQKRLTQEYTGIQEKIILIESAIEKQVAKVSDVIEQNFEFAQFKLFKSHFNGEIEPCCELMYKGARFNKELNNGAKTLVGLDIINTLSKHYKLHLPIFIDNAEGISYRLSVMDTQVIKLMVKTKNSNIDLELN